ncbi:biotin--[acetyl-CoA-carboxylase] ligase [Bowdeniella nasicola]|uniref:biotin--[biotin carboxyl-carrier protein] ligase n=1 Tax=Bowdeniella nasicola TaxID=208480 RepID=A0A1Q5Q2H7_9ACTO|nr:biotin--[acetyl-CoA-carboxylase] ligase [Bowdeniella nasicola]OKL54017.1 biotin--[acetyl-CoA-carboxylase] ligase [Bowdeniella nasicola]
MSTIRWVETTGSTSTDLLARCSAGEAAGGDALATFDQRAGRGRAGAEWVTAPGMGLALSVAIDASGVDLSNVASLVHPVGLAVRTVIAEAGAAGAALAWPNDIVVPYPEAVEGWGRWRKLGGILCERHASGLIIAGIGVNLDYPADRLPVAWATSLRQAAPEWDGDREALAERIVAEVCVADAHWREHGGNLSYLAEELARSSAWRDTVITARAGAHTLGGTFRGVDDSGAALIETPGGIERWISGEIRHVRAACDDGYTEECDRPR